MSLLNQKPFLYISPLSENGEFSIPLPVSGIQNALRLDVQRLCTYLPVPDQSKSRYLCEKVVSSLKNDRSVRKLEINPDQFLNDAYCFQKYFEALRVNKNQDDNSIKEIYEGVWSENNCNPLNMFDDRKLSDERLANNINSIYNYFFANDVVIFVEYGLHMNMNSRCNSVKSVTKALPIDEYRNQCYGMKSFQMIAYGFNVGFKFVISETQPDITNSYLWCKLTNEVFDTSDDFNIFDMIRYALLDFGGYELFRMPSTVNFTIKRQGYGFLLNFPDLETYLSVTVTAGRLPYVVNQFNNNEVRLKDRDYDEEVSQKIVVMRKTQSLLRPESGEYSAETYIVPSNYFLRDFYDDKHMRSTRIEQFTNTLEIDFIFDSALSTEPLCDVNRYGLSALFPVYGGFSLYFWMFFFTLYYVGLLKVEINKFFITPTALMNFVAGNAFGYDIIHGMFPFHIEGLDRLNPMKYLVNPESNTFFRLLFLTIKRNRSVGSRMTDVLKESFLVIGLDMYLGSQKLLVNGSTFVTDYLQQTYFQSAEEFPNIEINSSDASAITLVKSRRNIVMSDSFSTTVNLNTNVINPVIKLQFFGYDESLKKKIIKFEKGDKIIIKGQFQWLS